MEMTVLDWSVIAALIIFLTCMMVYSARFNKSIADFLSANRCAGRYLLSNAQGMAALGALAFILNFSIFYKAGFAPGYWGLAAMPLILFITLSGWVVYRFRQTRALTLAQFFEMRYNRRFRIFAGSLCWISGIVNYGIFPSIGARFFVNFCALPQQTHFVGLTFPTFWLVMIVLLFLSLLFTYKGGQITVLVTDFWQAFFAQFLFFAVVLFILFTFPWNHIGESLSMASKPGASLINPFDIGKQPDFNIIYYGITWVLVMYKVLAWQGGGTYQSCAITAHEQKMASAFGSLRTSLNGLVFYMVPIAAIVVMNHPSYSELAAKVTAHLSANFSGNEHTQLRMTVPTVIGFILPKGLVGAFAAAMLAFFISTNNTYMHSWGSILIQDVVVPFRGKSFEPKQQLFWLRVSIIFVAVFAFSFSVIFELRDYLLMFFAITGAIFIGGVGAVIIGGLYWKRGSTAGAFTAMIVGSVFALSSIICQGIWPRIPEKTAAWNHLEQGQDVQLIGNVFVDSNWPARDDTSEEVPYWNSVSKGLRFEATAFEVGKKALKPLPKQELRDIYGTEMLIGPVPITIEQIITGPVELKEYVFRSKIVEILGDQYYALSDGDRRIVAKIVPPFPLNGIILEFITCMLGIVSYVVVSLIFKSKPANMDKLLHRGKYVIASEEEEVAKHRGQEKKINPLWKFIGVNSHEFSRIDKGIFLFLFLYTVWVMTSFFGLMALHWFKLIGNNGWLLFWKISIYIQLFMAVVFVPWIAIAGLFDLKKMYRRLSILKRNHLDDGRVLEDIHED